MQKKEELANTSSFRLGMPFFKNIKVPIIVTQTLFETSIHYSLWTSSPPKSKSLTTYIATNGHFCSFVLCHDSSPPQELVWTISTGFRTELMRTFNIF